MVLETARKFVVLLIGGTVLLLGLLMLFTPGPGIAGILAGLAILATEFVWARVLLKRMKERAAAIARRNNAGKHEEDKGCGQESGMKDER